MEFWTFFAFIYEIIYFTRENRNANSSFLLLLICINLQTKYWSLPQNCPYVPRSRAWGLLCIFLDYRILFLIFFESWTLKFDKNNSLQNKNCVSIPTLIYKNFCANFTFFSYHFAQIMREGSTVVKETWDVSCDINKQRQIENLFCLYTLHSYKFINCNIVCPFTIAYMNMDVRWN